MAGKVSSKQMAEEILELVGGKENVVKAMCCMTRLRVTPVDESKIDFDGLNAKDYSIRVQVVAGVTQIVLGPGTVQEVEAEFQKLLGGTVNNNNEDIPEADEKFSAKAINFIQQTMMPFMGALIGGALLVALCNIISMFGVEITQETTPVLYLMNTLGSMATSYIGLFVAVTATRALGSKSFVPLMFAIFIYVGELTGTTVGPITLSNGIGGMIGIVMMVFIIVFLEKQVAKFVPKAISLVFVPFITTLIALFAFIFIVGPIGNLLSVAVMAFFNFFMNGGPVIYTLGHVLLAALYPLLVLSGTHMVVMALGLPYLETAGFMPLIAAGMLFTAMVGGACIGSIIKYKKEQKLVETATSGGITAFLGITEPAIYGVLLPKGKNFFLTMLAGGIGGFFVGIFGIQVGMGVPGIFVVTTVTDPATMMIPYLIIYIATAILSAALIILFGTKPENE